jgi:hypothetical protein
MAHSFKEKCLGNGSWITYIIPLKVSRWQKHWLLLKAVWFFWMINKNDILEIGFFLKKTREKTPKIVGIFAWKFWKKNVFSLLLWKNKHLKLSISKKRERGWGSYLENDFMTGNWKRKYPNWPLSRWKQVRKFLIFIFARRYEHH